MCRARSASERIGITRRIGESVNLLVDTSVWSLFLRRRKRNEDDPYVVRLRSCLEGEDGIHLIGPILQELLDGVRDHKQFELLKEYLEPFPLIALDRQDFVEASRLRNHCRGRGIQASPVDFLISTACTRRNYPLLTADEDFRHIAAHSKLMLIPVGL
ncbi:MAG: PIN domain-containing protein [Chitinivibrionales bacterium]|nr:PIN domain-containing protein [Chitinivibrionales bacterium]